MREPGRGFSAELLTSALARLPVKAWAQPVPNDDDDVNPGYRVAPLVQCGRAKAAAELFRFVLDEFAPVHTAWVARVPAGGSIGTHIDQGPYHERWHVPITAAGTFDDYEPVAGVPFPVAHWLPHRVDNPTERARVHLVIDRDIWANETPAPFQRIED